MAKAIVPLSDLLEEAKDIFRDKFMEEPTVSVYAPGRISLMGEHTEYHEGFVMAMALPLVTVMVGKKSAGDKSYLYTTASNVDGPQKAVIDMDNLDHAGPKWMLFIKGVIANYIGKAFPFKAVIHSTVPIGGGLSSSGALEVAVYSFLDDIGEPNEASSARKGRTREGEFSTKGEG
ncbi:hypothetical protein JTB14_000921 [Gonioctena quinquepunctata]|nr:hypothetical protein JTB14_000921 [Gonioctena quinquepunctata]